MFEKVLTLRFDHEFVNLLVMMFGCSIDDNSDDMCIILVGNHVGNYVWNICVDTDLYWRWFSHMIVVKVL